MVIILTILILLIVSILILYPMYTDLSEAPDLALRYLAKLDANLERRLNDITILIGIVRDEMKQDLTLVKEIESVRANIKSTKKRWNNAEERFKTQKILEEQMSYLYKSMRNYPNIRSNPNLRSALESLGNIEKYVLVDAYNYNDHLEKFNKLVNNFPSNLIAKALDIDCKFAPYPITTQAQKEAQEKNYQPANQAATEGTPNQPQAHYFEDDNDPGSFFSK